MEKDLNVPGFPFRGDQGYLLSEGENSDWSSHSEGRDSSTKVSREEAST